MKKAKRQIILLLNKNIVANVPLVTIAQSGCFALSAVVLTFFLWNLTRFELTAVQTVVGIALSSLTSLVLIGIGFVLPKVAAMESERSD